MTLDQVGADLLIVGSTLLMFVVMTGTIAKYGGRRPRLWLLFRGGPPPRSPFTDWLPGRLFALAVFWLIAIAMEVPVAFSAVYSSRLADRLFMVGGLLLAGLWIVYLLRLQPTAPSARPRRPGG